MRWRLMRDRRENDNGTHAVNRSINDRDNKEMRTYTTSSPMYRNTTNAVSTGSQYMTTYRPCRRGALSATDVLP